MTPLISVVMPSLNVARYYEECLLSVIRQTLDNIEIICVDAGSTDGTYEIIEKYAKIDSRIRVIKSDKKSYGYQMNMGIDMASGEYIGIVETDDYIADNMYEKLYELVKTEKCDFVKGNFIKFFDYNGKTVFSEQNTSFAINDVNKKIILSENERLRLIDINHIWSGIYKREFLINKKIVFNETAGASFQDTSFSVICGLSADTCIYYDTPYYYYRIDNANSSVKSDGKLFCVVDEYDYIDSYVSDNLCLTENMKNDLIRAKLICFYWNANRLNNEARKIFLSGIESHLQTIYESRNELDDNCISLLDSMLDINVFNYMEDKRNKQIVRQKQVLADIQNNEEGYIAVSAGNLFKRMVEIQNAINAHIIEAVVDNDQKKQGKNIESYKVLSVDEAKEKYIELKWMVLNKHHSKEIVEDLVNNGIEKNDIVVIDNLFPLEDLLIS